MSIRSLIWSTVVDEDALPIFKYRLFGAGLQGQLFEIDLKEMRVVVQSDSYGGPVCLRRWFSALVRFIGRPRDVPAFYSDVRITTSFSPSCKSRIVSCGWSPDGSMIACGSSNSRFYVYHIDSGRTDSIAV